jgi:hypothetical protein
LIDYLRFYVPLKNFSLIWRCHHCRWRATKFRPMLGAQGLWAGRDLYRATPAVIRDLGFSGLIRRTAPFSRLLRQTRGCGGYILTRIPTGSPTQFTRSVQYLNIHQYIIEARITAVIIFLKDNILKTIYLSPIETRYMHTIFNLGIYRREPEVVNTHAQL